MHAVSNEETERTKGLGSSEEAEGSGFSVRRLCGRQQALKCGKDLDGMDQMEGNTVMNVQGMLESL